MDFVAGTVGGCFGIVISHPVDTLRIRYQAQKIGEPILRTALYSGVSAPLVGMMMEKSIVFGVYSLVKAKTNHDFLAGLSAGLACTTIVTPIEKIKINLQNGSLSTRTMSIRYLYNGYAPTLFREVPGFGLYFTCYQYLRERYNQEQNPLKTLLFGGMSGSFAWIFIYPADVVKTRLQSDNLHYTSARECFRDTLKTRGWRFFFKGQPLAILRAFQLHSGVWLGYELCISLFKHYYPQ